MAPTLLTGKLGCPKLLSLVCLSFFALPLASVARPGAQPVEPPPLVREFRAAWIATVANIDWPSRPGLSVQKQQAEMVALLDMTSRLNMNAVVLQVRPACDAIYPSQLEPWSQYVTGQQGQPPADGFDPLKFAIDQAHARGIQVHAWFNPYRAGHPTRKGELAENHVSRTIPEAVVEYGDYLWLDPGHKLAEQHSLNVIRDVVKRYDIDGVHFDDYFYPYPVKEKSTEEGAAAKEVPFPDDISWNEYLAKTPNGAQLLRDDWRRENVNRFMRRVREVIQQEKPWVLFGVSPFGIYRPGYPDGIAGFDQYDKLYADARLWLTKGWVDYFTPQLYWPIRSTGQCYPVLLEWWARQNPHGRHLWPGNFTSKLLNDASGWKAREVVEQVRITQAMSGAGGNVHFSIKALQRNSGGVADALIEGPYAEPAVIPATPWAAKDAAPPAMPKVVVSPAGKLRFTSGDGRPVWQWAVQVKTEEGWNARLIPGQVGAFVMSKEEDCQSFSVRAIDRLGRASEPVVLPKKN